MHISLEIWRVTIQETCTKGVICSAVVCQTALAGHTLQESRRGFGRALVLDLFHFSYPMSTMRSLLTADRKGAWSTKIFIFAYIWLHSLSGADDNSAGYFTSVYVRSRTLFMNWKPFLSLGNPAYCNRKITKISTACFTLSMSPARLAMLYTRR